MRIKLLKYIFVFVVPVLLISCSSAVRYTSSNISGKNSQEINSSVSGSFSQTGLASYYADKFDGRTTANGEIFSQNKFTAAHKTLPFGTKLKVTNIKNGKSVVVTVNDRGPYADGRIIDLSKAAAAELGMLNSGVAEVKIETINK
jgi:rare lipoprotein A